MKKILIVGGGFAGLWAALAAKREIEEAREGNGTSVTLVSRDGYLTVRPRCTGAAARFQRRCGPVHRAPQRDSRVLLR